MTTHRAGHITTDQTSTVRSTGGTRPGVLGDQRPGEHHHGRRLGVAAPVRGAGWGGLPGALTPTASASDAGNQGGEQQGP
jgi:hypothetical protein